MMARSYSYLVLVLAWALIGDAQAIGQDQTVPGPEARDLLPMVAGDVLSDGEKGIVAIRLPALGETVVAPTAAPNPQDDPTIHALSGPDADGRVAYVEDHFFVEDKKNERHLLKVIRLDGTHDTVLFSRRGNAMWAASPAGHGEIGQCLALSPVHGRVAFLSELVPTQMPSAYLHVGSIEFWDINTKTGRKMDIQALDEGLAWFPDGNHLAYVKLVDPKTTVDMDLTDALFGQAFRRWQKVPAVFIRDLDAGTDVFLHVGWHPAISWDGRSVLVSDLQSNWQRVDVASRQGENITWPAGFCGSVVAYPAKDLALAWCLPTQGDEVKYTQNNSPLRGPKEMLTLKLVKLNGKEFQTVIRNVDPRTHVSFGQVHQNAEPKHLSP